MSKESPITMFELNLVLERIAGSLERSADYSQKQLEAYNKQNHETLIIMAEREKRDLAQVERIKERHEWDRELHETMIKEKKLQIEREELWIKQIKDKELKGGDNWNLNMK